MKNIQSTSDLKPLFVLIFVVVGIMFSPVLIGWVTLPPLEERIQKRHQAQIGTYRLDLSKTDLGIYAEHKKEYSKLVLILDSNSTFHFNMRTPFLEDSSGRWNTGSGAIDTWNSLYYQKYGLDKYEPNVGGQFGELAADSTFALLGEQLNYSNPNSIYIWFKKIK